MQKFLIRFSNSRRERGDTLVEVLLAMVVISVVIAGAYTLTNRATRINQLAFERTTAVSQLREQIEYIRGMQVSARDQVAWTTLSTSYISSTPPSYVDCVPTSSVPFYADPNQGYDSPSAINAYSGGDNDAYPTDFYKVWVEAYRPTGQDYVDFHVRACWQGAGSGGQQRSALVLRMAE